MADARAARAALAHQQLSTECRSSLLVFFLQSAVLVQGYLLPHERRFLTCAACLSALSAAVSCLRPHWYGGSRGPRLLLAACVRCTIMLIPVFVDAVRAVQPNLAAAAAAAGGGGGSALGSGTAMLRALLLLMLPVAWVHVCFLAGCGWQLDPLPHAVLQVSGVAVIIRRAPAACSSFIAQHHANLRLTTAVYWLMRQVTSVLCLGSREALEVAAAAGSDAEKCTAVVWSLEASLGLALPTLLVWRTHQHLEQQVAAWHRRRGQHAATAQQQGAVPTPSLQYRLLVKPVVQAADELGSYLLVFAIWLAAFIAAVIWQWRHGTAAALTACAGGAGAC